MYMWIWPFVWCKGKYKPLHFIDTALVAISHLYDQLKTIQDHWIWDLLIGNPLFEPYIMGEVIMIE